MLGTGPAGRSAFPSRPAQSPCRLCWRQGSITLGAGLGGGGHLSESVLAASALYL